MSEPTTDPSSEPLHAFEPDGTPSPGALLALNGKSDIDHTHPPDDIEGLVARLAALEAATHDTGWIDLVLEDGYTSGVSGGSRAQICAMGKLVLIRGRIGRTEGVFEAGQTHIPVWVPAEFRPGQTTRRVFGGGPSSQWGRLEASAPARRITIAAISGDLGWFDIDTYWTTD